MISGNRMVKQNRMQNQSVDPKPVIHKLSDYNQNIEGGNAHQVIKPKKQNMIKVDSSLRQPVTKDQAVRKPLHQNSQQTNPIKNEQKQKFMSIARHGVKIGGQVIGMRKWQCKICKLVNQNASTSCLRCQSEKGEIKVEKLEEKRVIKQPRQVLKNKPL